MTPEHDKEIDVLAAIARMENVWNYLEVGSRYGISIERVANALPQGARIVSVDLPGGLWGKSESIVQLRSLFAELKHRGYDAHLFEGDSKDPAIIEQVRALGPFDLAYIDGDHTYEGVTADWENYGPMCRAVAFDDIWSVNSKVAPDGSHVVECGVPDFWPEVREGKRYMDIAGTKNRTHGIGVLWQ